MTTCFESACQVLRDNDRGGYTVPSRHLYPFQWNWDAAFTALGWMCFDEPRAWREFDTLMQGLWREGPQTGLLPHIVFHQPSSSYFPGPDDWGTEALRTPPTSSISQPPVHATVMRHMWARARDKSLARSALTRLLPDLLLHHLWWYRDRDPDGSGLVFITHPWESGMDNSPAWDAPLRAVPPTSRSYTRLDLNHVDDAMRPHRHEYDRYVMLMDLNRQWGFDARRIAGEMPFRVHDIGTISILHRSTIDLVALYRELGLAGPVPLLETALARTVQAVSGLWSAALGQFVSADARTGERIDVPTHAGLLALYAGLAGGDTAPTLARTALDWLDETPSGLASTRLRAPQFEAQRYWRGPVWAHMNWLIAQGLDAAGHAAASERLREGTRQLIETEGFHEYYDPLTGHGLGGPRFSWTAATYLFWLADRG